MFAKYPWLAPLAALSLLQMGGSFLVQLIPTMAPVFVEAFGWSRSTVGYFSAGVMLGTFSFLLLGMPIIRGFGPVRTIQMGLCLGAFGVALFEVPLMAAHILAAFLIGFSYGPTAPAGGEVLQRVAPPAHRALIFSIRQAAVPVGGALAGLLLPLAVGLAGWRATLFLVILAALVLALAAQPVRNAADETHKPQGPKPRAYLSFRNMREPFVALMGNGYLSRIALAGGSLAITQGAWNAFLITYLFNDVGMSLASAGAVFSINQLAAVVGRVALGWVADRLASAIRVMLVLSLGAGVVTAVIALAQPDWPFALTALVAAGAGFSAAGWNGILQAELARLAPKNKVVEVSAGGTIIVSLGLVLGPLLFATLMATLGGLRTAFVALAVFPVLSFVLFLRAGAAEDQ